MAIIGWQHSTNRFDPLFLDSRSLILPVRATALRGGAPRGLLRSMPFLPCRVLGIRSRRTDLVPLVCVAMFRAISRPLGRPPGFVSQTSGRQRSPLGSFRHRRGPQIPRGHPPFWQVLGSFRATRSRSPPGSTAITAELTEIRAISGPSPPPMAQGRSDRDIDPCNDAFSHAAMVCGHHTFHTCAHGCTAQDSCMVAHSMALCDRKNHPSKATSGPITPFFRRPYCQREFR
jgi:hypothetical protein